MQELPWDDPAWVNEAGEWIGRGLAQCGLRAAGPVEWVHRRQWSALATVATSGSKAYFKATAPAVQFEIVLTEGLAALRPDITPALLAADAERGWLLSRDGGERLRDRWSKDGLAHWQRLAKVYAGFQIEMAGRVSNLLAMGVPDCRLASLPVQYEELLRDTDYLRLGQPDALTAEEHARLWALRPRVVALCEQLAEMGPCETLVHQELHDSNVLVGGSEIRIIDWSEACVGHPFMSAMFMLGNLADRLGIEDVHPERIEHADWAGVRDAYLSAWTGIAPRSELLAALRLAWELAVIERALAEHRVFKNLPQERWADDNDMAEWLRGFIGMNQEG